MAPFAHRVTRVTISGTSLNGAEEWSTGFFMGYESGDADLPNQQLADDIANAWKTYFTHASAAISNTYESLLVKVSSIGTDGKSNANDTVYGSFTTATKGASSQLLPPQVALVCTLTGAQARGLATKGRMYLPGVAHSVGSNGKVLSASITAHIALLKTFFTAVNASTATNNVVVLASHGQLNKDGSPKIGGYGPVIKAVTGLKMGDVYDTQRRRRNGLTETYQVAAGPF